jgi:wyosine [tRNA(Phe)-imidazoG37] synthetase (radical SAM superfamily)
MRLRVGDHDRSSAGLVYVYAVLSRRSGGISLGINLSPNNACNWRCVYCQVPGLVLEKPPPIDLALLERELFGLLEGIVRGDWIARAAPGEARRLADVAFSGNGEPTASPQFADAVELAGRALAEFGLAGEVPIVLITNGSLLARPDVQRGLERLAELGGRVWFKLDSATEAGQRRLGSSALGPARTLKHLELAARRAPTWIQTMALDWNGPTLSGGEEQAYLDLLGEAVRRGLGVRGVLLYGLARPSHQPEAPELRPLPPQELERLAGRIRELGLECSVFP